MGKIVGITLLMGGIAGSLYQWIESQKVRSKRLEEFIVFIHKFIFAMETEKVKVIEYISNYNGKDEVLEKTLGEIGLCLKENRYPQGQSVWESVLKKEEKNWAFDKETFDVIIKCGIGFFGKSREENISFLKKQLEELEALQRKKRQEDTKERKVWIPVSVMGGLMVVLLFV